MDNVTHSLIGVVLGEGILRARAKDSGPQARSARRTLRSGILWATVLASNLPDSDILLRPIVRGGKLGYLLHHRGYTHTVTLSILFALIAASAGKLAAKFAAPAVGEPAPSVPWRELLIAGWAGVLFHIGADFWNDYGVHPFWPFVNRWVYGDFIFIVEPLLWLAMLPFVHRWAESKWARAVCWVLGGAIITATWWVELTSWPVALWVTLWGAGWVCLSLRARSVAPAFAGILGVLLLFSVTSQLVRAPIRKALPEGERLLDLVSSPAPANPLCWRVILSSVGPDGVYRARQGVATLGTGLFGKTVPTDPERCFGRLQAGRTAPLEPIEAPALNALPVKWHGEFRGEVSELRALLPQYCRVRALLRYARIPFWLRAGQETLVAGDLRFDREAGLGFAEIESRQGEPCYPFEPAWDYPSGLISD